MKRFTRLISAMIVFSLMLLSLVSCSDNAQTQEKQDDTLSVYTSFFPIYALTDMLIENTSDVELHCLVQPQDGCLRGYYLSDWDLSLLSHSADAVIIGGRGLESFESILYALGENGPSVSAILYNMELKNASASNTDPDSDSHWNSDNPHIYMQAGGAIEILNRISEHLKIIDPANSEIYAKNVSEAENRLKSLSVELQNAVGAYKKAKVAVMNEALLYTALEYNLDIALAYDRESGESLEGSDLQSCIELLKSSGAEIVLIEKQAPQTLCEKLEESGFILARMDIMSTRRASEGWNGFLNAYRENAHALEDALTAANMDARTVSTGE